MKRLSPRVIGSGFRAGAGRLLVALLAAILFLFIAFPLAALVLHTPPGSMWTSLQTQSATSALFLTLGTTKSGWTGTTT